jgi:hypothetical protein
MKKWQSKAGLDRIEAHIQVSKTKIRRNPSEKGSNGVTTTITKFDGICYIFFYPTI